MFLVRAILIIYITRYCQVFLKAYLSVYGLSQSIVLLNTLANGAWLKMVYLNHGMILAFWVSCQKSKYHFISIGYDI